MRRTNSTGHSQQDFYIICDVVDEETNFYWYDKGGDRGWGNRFLVDAANIFSRGLVKEELVYLGRIKYVWIGLA